MYVCMCVYTYVCVYVCRHADIAYRDACELLSTMCVFVFVCMCVWRERERESENREASELLGGEAQERSDDALTRSTNRQTHRHTDTHILKSEYLVHVLRDVLRKYGLSKRRAKQVWVV